MSLRLVITSYQRRRLKEAGVKEFGTRGGSIGRSLDSDWILQDGERYVSSRHASIDFRSGSYYIIDTSSNGVYINDDANPVGKARPQRLFDGDRLRIGAYEMVAHITESASERDQLSDLHHVDPVDRAKFVDQPEPTGQDLVSEQELTAKGVDELLREGAEASALKRAAIKATAFLRRRTEAAKRRRTAKTGAGKSALGSPRPKVSGKNLSGSSPSVALYAFFRGAGIAPRDIDEQQATFMLHRLGRLMRELLTGLTDAQHFRAEQKSQLGIPSTKTQPNSDTPKIFAAGVDEALNTLITESAVDYKSTIDATREAFQDEKNHQEAMLGAVEIALSDFLDRLDPDELKKSIDHDGKRNNFFSSSNKKRYWDQYRNVFQAISQRSPGHLPQRFAAELSRAYVEEVAHLKGKRQTDNAARDVLKKLRKRKSAKSLRKRSA